MRRSRRRSYAARPLRLAARNKKIGGVCAGVANYFGWSSFSVRIAAIIALCFMPHITLPAYFLAYVILDREPEELYDL